jgi:hypothetical protein
MRKRAALATGRDRRGDEGQIVHSLRTRQRASDRSKRKRRVQTGREREKSKMQRKMGVKRSEEVSERSEWDTLA